MTRKIEKKEWRSIVESVLEVENNLKKCITSSDEFPKLSEAGKTVLINGTDNSLLVNYLSSYKYHKNKFSENNLAVHNTQSQFWVDNYENLSKIHEKCNLFSYYEAMEEKFNLIYLKGHYDSQH